MRLLGESSEAEMVLTFLCEEITSPRFRGRILEALDGEGAGEGLVLRGDTGNREENALRARVLGAFRGYPDREIFENYPQDMRWTRVLLEAADLPRLRYVDYDYWNELSRGTSCPLGAAETIREGREVFGVSNAPYLQGRAFLEGGGRFPPLILLTCARGPLLILEGHCRATALALAPQAVQGTEALLGTTSEADFRKKAGHLFRYPDKEDML